MRNSADTSRHAPAWHPALAQLGDRLRHAHALADLKTDATIESMSGLSRNTMLPGVLRAHWHALNKWHQLLHIRRTQPLCERVCWLSVSGASCSL